MYLISQSKRRIATSVNSPVASISVP